MTYIIVTAEQWAELLQLVVLLPLGCIVLWTIGRDFDLYEYRVRRFLRRRRIRAIRLAREGRA
jgi:hypothetical protein